MGSSSKQNFSAKLIASKPWGAFKKADTWVLVSEFLIQCSGLGPGNQKKKHSGDSGIYSLLWETFCGRLST